MTALQALAALAAAGMAGGALLLACGVRPRPSRPARPSGRAAHAAAALRRFAGLEGPARERRAQRARLAAAAALGTAAYLLTAVPALAAAAVFAALGAPVLLQTGKAPARRIALQAALAQWTRALAVRIATGSGLEQALIATAHDAPAAVAEYVQDLAARLEHGWSTGDALTAFARESADPTADYIAAALRRAAARRGPGLSAVLHRLSAAVEARVRTRQKVEAERARIRTTVRLINIIVLGMFAALQVDGAFMQPYRTAAGQLVLTALAGCYAGCLTLMDRLARGRPEPRLLGPAARGATEFRVFGRPT